jgi:hypothetical protein
MCPFQKGDLVRRGATCGRVLERYSNAAGRVWLAVATPGGTLRVPCDLVQACADPALETTIIDEVAALPRCEAPLVLGGTCLKRVSGPGTRCSQHSG